jgi:hypothetical protein
MIEKKELMAAGVEMAQRRITHFRRRLSWTTHSTLSHLQLPQGAPSTTSQRTLRARQLTQARAARLLVTLAGGAVESASDAVRFLLDFGDVASSPLPCAASLVASSAAGRTESSGAGSGAGDDSVLDIFVAFLGGAVLQL